MAQFALAESLGQKRTLINQALEQRLPPADTEPCLVHEAMRYATFGPGKRLRPALALGVCEIAGAPYEEVLDAACAIELIHTASLVLDDLPSMDNAEGRRGVPCTHHKYGEATAILAAMGLVALAFELMTRNAAQCGHVDDANTAIRLLAQAMGTSGIIGGQHVDLGLIEQSATLEELAKVYMQKAGALFLASVTIPAHLLGMEPARIEALKTYAEDLGLAFQITDDLIDEKASTAEEDRTSFTTHLGVSGAQQKVDGLIRQAIDALHGFDERADILRSIAEQVGTRTH